jgi:plasmid stabilization system protein ParE
VKKKVGAQPHKVFLTDRSISDLLAIETYSIEEWGERVAATYIGKFEKAFKLLELNPGLLHQNPTLSDGLFFYRVEKHLMACVKIEKGIAVLTIIHANRDIVGIIHELAPTLKEDLVILLNKIARRHR